jgi:hypothetical protein
MTKLKLLLFLAVLVGFAAIAYAGFDEVKAGLDRGAYAKAYQEFKTAADQGDAKAQENLGSIYLGLVYCTEAGIGAQTIDHWLQDQDSKGRPSDPAQALKWFRKAAEHGLPNSQYYLGFMYENGIAVPQDCTEAAKWYHKAAKQGHVDAQYQLGVMCASGRGVRQDYSEAAKWYRKAGKQGKISAQTELSRMYTTGQGVPQSDIEALKWSRKAEEEKIGFAPGMLELAELAMRGNASGGDVQSTNESITKTSEKRTPKTDTLKLSCSMGESNFIVNVDFTSSSVNGCPAAIDDDTISWYVGDGVGRRRMTINRYTGEIASIYAGPPARSLGDIQAIEEFESRMGRSGKCHEVSEKRF